MRSKIWVWTGIRTKVWNFLQVKSLLCIYLLVFHLMSPKKSISLLPRWKRKNVLFAVKTCVFGISPVFRFRRWNCVVYLCFQNFNIFSTLNCVFYLCFQNFNVFYLCFQNFKIFFNIFQHLFSESNRFDFGRSQVLMISPPPRWRAFFSSILAPLGEIPPNSDFTFAQKSSNFRP